MRSSFAVDYSKKRDPLKIIKDGSAFVRVLVEGRVRELLPQLEDPARNRPVKYPKKPPRRYNPNTHKMEDNISKRAQGAPNKKHTKKVSTSLLPVDGRMKLYNSKNKVGFLFDGNYCNLKDEKYFFTKDADFDIGWHHGEDDETVLLEDHDGVKKEKTVGEIRAPILITKTDLAGLRQHNADCRGRGEIPEHNEAVIGVSKESLSALFATRDKLWNRVEALVVKTNNQSILGDIPLIIIDPKLKEPIYYTIEAQAEDVIKLLKSDSISDKLTALHIIKYTDNEKLLVLLNEHLDGFARLLRKPETLVVMSKEHGPEFFKNATKKNKALFNALVFHPDHVLDEFPSDTRDAICKHASFNTNASAEEVDEFYQENPLFVLDLFYKGVLSKDVLKKMKDDPEPMPPSPYKTTRKMIKYFLKPEEQFLGNKDDCISLLNNIFSNDHPLIAQHRLLDVMRISSSKLEPQDVFKIILEIYIKRVHFSILVDNSFNIDIKVKSCLSLLEDMTITSMEIDKIADFLIKNKLTMPAKIRNNFELTLLTHLKALPATLNIILNTEDKKEIRESVCKARLGELRTEAAYLSTLSELVSRLYETSWGRKKFPDVQGCAKSLEELVKTEINVVNNVEINNLIKKLKAGPKISADKTASSIIAKLDSILDVERDVELASHRR